MTEQQPIYIISPDTQRTSGKSAQRNNIMVTNDGVTILEEMHIEHPAAKMVVAVAKTQEAEVGDGTTTAVILAGELLKNAELLLDKEIHPTVITKGYRMAAEKAQELLNYIAKDVSINDEDILKNIAMTAMTGKGAEVAKENLSDIIVSAILQIADTKDNKIIIDLENIKLEKKVGGGIEDSELIQGIVLDKEKVHPGMPKQMRNAKIALLDVAVEIKSAEIDTKIQISSPEQIEAFMQKEEEMIRKMADKIIKSGANVIFCQKRIDDVAQHYLAKAGIYAARRIKK